MSWYDSLKIYGQANVLRMLTLGFSAGLPLLLIFGTLSFWLREAGVDLSTIGFFSWVGLVYAFKWVWSPLVDQLEIPYLTKKLGRRRSWLLIAQLSVMGALIGLAITDPSIYLSAMVLLALWAAFSSATQDIALDAFRIESGGHDDQGAMAAAYQLGYRIAMIVASAGALFLASFFDQTEDLYESTPWFYTYLVMSSLMLIGVVTTLLSPEPIVQLDRDERSSKKSITRTDRLYSWSKRAIVMPFVEFITRYRSQAILLLLMIGLYRISDVVMGVMANPFYIDMGYSKSEIATVSKFYGVVMTIIGALLGGVLVKQLGLIRTLFLGAVLSSLTNCVFAWLSTSGASILHLVVTISLDNLSAGIATAAFVAYLSSLTNINYSATQYALFSSLMFLGPKFLAGWSGIFVEQYGYNWFFLGTALLGLPVLILIVLVRRAATFER